MKKIISTLLMLTLPVIIGCENKSYQINGTVISEKRGYNWYQVSLKPHNANRIRVGTTSELRFYNSKFDLNKIDKDINIGNKIYIIGKELITGEMDWIAEEIDRIE